MELADAPSAGGGQLGTLGDYSQVARHTAPTLLARAAARRMYRVARKTLYRRRPSSISEHSLLNACQAASASDLADRLFAGRSERGWCEVARRAAVRFALERTPGAIERALARADRALVGTFEVFGTTVERRGSLGRGPETDWSLDPVIGYRYPRVAADQIQVLAGGVDPKFPWVFGRFDHGVALAQGFWLSDPSTRNRYAEAFVAEVRSFIRANPVGIGVHWTSPMEVALRAANLAQAVVMLSDAPAVCSGEFLLLFLTALARHVEFVEAHLEDTGVVPNNHLIANHLGLWVVGLLFPQLPSSARHVALAAEGLRAQMQAQVHPDGCSFEGSISYHRLATEMFTLAELSGRDYGAPLGSAFTDRLRSMFHVARAYCSEQGLAAQIGDNDSGRIWPLRDRDPRDHGYLAPLGAALFNSAHLRAPNAEFPDEAAWLLGKEGLERFQQLSSMETPSFVSDFGAWAVLRGGGGVVSVGVGKNGQAGMGGHSHNDKLSFELHVEGVPVIVDSGTGTYSRDAAMRNAFRSTAAHNTLELDGVEQAPFDPKRLFFLPDGARAELDLFQSTSDFDRLIARHFGYSTLKAPGQIERAFVLDKVARALCVADSVLGSGHHDLISRLHFPDGNARLRPCTRKECSRAGLLLGAPRDFDRLGIELGPVDRPHALVLIEHGSKLQLEGSQYSPGYGETHSALTMVMRRTAELPVRIGYVVLWNLAGE